MSDFKQNVKKSSPVLGIFTATIILLGTIITAVTILLPLYLKEGDVIILPTIIIIVGILFSWIGILFIFKIINYLDEKDILKYFLYKWREFVILATTKQKINIPYDIKYDCTAFYKYFKNRLDILQDFTCMNQGEIAQFYYLAGENHRALKEEINNNCGDIDRIKEELEKFRTTTYLMMAGNNKVFDKCCMKINKYFSERHKENPRVCIKIYEKDGISDFYRFGDKTKNKISDFNDNTGFFDVREKGKYYLCNNIPEMVGKEKYYNQRLKGEDVREYQRAHGEINDHATWCKFWRPYELKGESDVSPESCYMSTLVTPMTLFNNKDLDDRFRKKFADVEKQIYTDEEKQRFIYGFLCLDHVEKFYFNEELDYRVNYIFADLLSVYLIAFYMYTDYSNTFKNAQEVIKAAC